MGNANAILPITQLTSDEEMVRDLARKWSNETLKPVVREMDNQSQIKKDILNDLFEYGFMGLEIDEIYGGIGMNFMSSCLVIEEIARVDPSVAILVDIHNTLTNNAIRYWGSDELKSKWLPRLATDTISSFALSEAESGSDAFAMKTTATLCHDDDGSSYYTINGTKLWISNSKEAGVFLVFANVDLSLGYKGITAFLVDANIDGITVGKPEKKLGLRASSTCPVIFDNVKVNK